jgi:hypothetical protein
MKAELAELQPKLEARAAATAALLQQVSRDQAQAQAVKTTVVAEEREVKAMAGATQVGGGWGGATAVLAPPRLSLAGGRCW